jgi:hypothetical protein
MVSSAGRPWPSRLHAFGLAKLVVDDSDDTSQTRATARVSAALSRSGAVTGTAERRQYKGGLRRDAAAAEVLRGLVEDFAGATPQDDDVTVLVLRVLGLDG